MFKRDVLHGPSGSSTLNIEVKYSSETSITRYFVQKTNAARFYEGFTDTQHHILEKTNLDFHSSEDFKFQIELFDFSNAIHYTFL
jgi:hypothetical protein